MNLINYCGKNGEKHVYSHFYDGKLHIFEVAMGDDAIVKKLNDIKVTIVVCLFEDFLKSIQHVFPSENQLQSLNEARAKIIDFIVWCNTNAHLVEDIFSWAKKMLKRANIIMNEIPSSNELKKDLIFLLNCVTLTVENRITT